jgi:prophage antirepressor-like protein
MIEEIKTDNNCIVKAFENNPISIIHEDINNKRIYYFKASDVGKVLDIVNIRTSIINFDEDEKVVRTTYSSNSGNPETIFLSSQGVYRLLYNSKKEIAKKFRKWAGNILDDIIFNQSKELQRQLEEQKLLLIEQREQTEQEKEQLLETTLLNQYHKNVQCIYYGKIDNKDTVGGSLVKFGMSNNLQERVKNHKKTYTNFRLTNVFKVSNQIEIENCIKNHPILKKRIRSIMLNDLNYRELIYIDSTKNEPDFSLETLDEYIKQIIEENQYNLENYKRLLEKNETLESEIYTLRQTSKTLQEENTKLKNKIDKFKPNPEEKRLMTHNKIDTINGYSLFAFECDKQNFRYKINLCKTLTLELREKTYKITFPDCELKYQTKIKHAFIEKILLYLLKRHLTFLNNETYDGSLENIKLIFNIVSKIEDLLINNDLENIFKILNNEKIETILNDPEIPFIKKSKRSIDQVDPTTGTVNSTNFYKK